jgi:NTE family protein
MAKGYDLVVVIALRVMGSAGGRRDPLDGEIEALRAAGAQVQLLMPDAPSQAVFGPNLMDARRRPGAAQAGLDQGRAAAAALATVWGA